MKLTLEKVHRILGSVLHEQAVGIQAYVDHIEESPIACGVVLGADGVLYYNPEWWDEYINTPQKARHAVMAEVMRRVLGCDRRSSDWISRLAAGMVINSFLYDKYGYHELPRAMYSAVELPECLLHPYAKGYPSRFRKLYQGVWKRDSRYTSVENVDRALRVLFNSQDDLKAYKLEGGAFSSNPEDLPVLGYLTGTGDGEEEGIAVISKGMTDALPDDLLDVLAKGICKSAGYSTEKQDSVMDKLKNRRTLETKLIRDYGLDKIKKRIRMFLGDPEKVSSVVPRNLSNRDAMRLAMGHDLTRFQNKQPKEELGGGVAMYMDVSGSFWEFVGYVLGVLENAEKVVEHIYQFSNGIAETSIEELKKNQVLVGTTGGTDFDCIFKHAIEHEFTKVIVVTDGYGDINTPEVRKAAESHVKKAMFLIATDLPSGGKSRFATKSNLDNFKKETWVGKHYGIALDLSDVFRGRGDTPGVKIDPTLPPLPDVPDGPGG